MKNIKSNKSKEKFFLSTSTKRMFKLRISPLLPLYMDIWRKSSDKKVDCLRNRTTLPFDFLIYGLCANLCCSGTWVDWWLINKKCLFPASHFIFACRFVLYLYVCAVKNSEIPGFCVPKRSVILLFCYTNRM